MSAPLLEVRDLSVRFAMRRGWLGRRHEVVRAVSGVSFALEKGQTLGLVGESGCGKSTTARAILRLVAPSDGTVLLEGEDLGALSARALRQRRPKMQMIFQDPYASLDPRMTVHGIVAEPLRTHRVVQGRTAIAERVIELLARVGRDRRHARRHPHPLSGRQRPRGRRARALSPAPAPN